MKKTCFSSHTRTVLSLGALALAFTGGLLLAGPLDPPAGPVTPSYKTLNEVEPRIAVSAANTPGDADSIFKITQRGSYYLTGSITGVAGKHGVEIAASGVTLDLNGFDLQGVPGMGNFDGVNASVAGLTNIAVVNGSIRGWGGDGVDLWFFSVVHTRIAGVIANGNTGTGIRVGGDGIVTGCSATGNGGHGIQAGNASTISGCSAQQNSGSGIGVDIGCTITGCIARSNTIYGIACGAGSTISECASSANSFHGMFVGDGSTVTACAVHQNVGCGISTNSGCTVSGCTARANTLDGILVQGGCAVRANDCSGNGAGAGDGAGIHATGDDNRIEGNTCAGADRGIHVIFFGSIIIRNTCSGNTTNWVIAADNSVAPIVQASSNAAGISGNTYTGTLGSTDPNANFTY